LQVEYFHIEWGNVECIEVCLHWQAIELLPNLKKYVAGQLDEVLEIEKDQEQSNQVLFSCDKDKGYRQLASSSV
jgi:hypothetical protein